LREMAMSAAAASEQDVREVALQVIRTGKPELRSYCSERRRGRRLGFGSRVRGAGFDVYLEPAGPRARERALLDERQPFVACGLMPERGNGSLSPQTAPKAISSRKTSTRASRARHESCSRQANRESTRSPADLCS